MDDDELFLSDLCDSHADAFVFNGSICHDWHAFVNLSRGLVCHCEVPLFLVRFVCFDIRDTPVHALVCKGVFWREIKHDKGYA